MGEKIIVPDMFGLSNYLFNGITEFIESIDVSFHFTDDKQGLDILVSSDVAFATEEDGKIVGDIVAKTLPLESMLDRLYLPKSEAQREEVENAVVALENLAKKAREKYLGG